MKTNSVPKIRFKGFTDDWEQRKVRDVADRFDNLRIPVAANLRVPGTTPYYGANGIQDYVEGFTHDGEFVLVAEDGANDLKNYPVKCVKGRIWVNNHAHVLQGKQNIADNQFLAFSINRTDIESLLVGGGRAKLNAETMMDMSLSLPKIEEQRSIGNYISTLDRLITLHQRKCEQTKELKKFMLQKMFPKKGEKNPEIRFSGFTDDWEQRKLGDCCEQIKETVDPQQNPDVKYWEYSMPAFDNGNKPDLVCGSEMNSIRKVINTSCLLINKLNVRKKRIWLVETPLNNAVCSAEFVPIVSENVDLRFIKYIVSENKFTRYLEDCSSGSSNSQKRVTPDVIMSAVIKVPTIAEQQKIGEYFSNLDRLITLHQRKCEQLKELKKFMLQNMFPKKG